MRNPSKSVCSNPITHIFRKHQKAYDLESEVEIIETEDGLRNRFRGVVYHNQRTLDRDIKRLRKMLLNEVGKDIDNFVMMIAPPTGAPNDKIWEDGARNAMKGFIYAMLEDSRKETAICKTLITEDTFSMSTLIDLVDSLNIREKPDYFIQRKPDSKALKYVIDNILTTSPVTAASYKSVLSGMISPFREPAIRLITSCNSFEFEDLLNRDKPVVIYICYKDEEPESYFLISMFIQQLYVFLIGEANARANGKLETPWYFMLDEFGNLPKLKNFDTVISACRGRNIFFTLVIQSYAQLENVYGRTTAEIIKDNISVRIFLGSGNYYTLEAISKECGKITRISPLSALNGDKDHIENYALETVPLMPVSRLSKLEEGEAIINVVNSGCVLLSKLERYYKCKEFEPIPAKDIGTVSDVDPFDDKYEFTFIPLEKRR